MLPGAAPASGFARDGPRGARGSALRAIPPGIFA